MLVAPSGDSATETFAVTGPSSPGWDYLVNLIALLIFFSFFVCNKLNLFSFIVLKRT